MTVWIFSEEKSVIKNCKQAEIWFKRELSLINNS